MTERDSGDDQLIKVPYIIVTNKLFGHPKYVRLSDKAKVYLLELWGYCNEYETDGIVHKTVLEQKGSALAKQLKDAGWVDPTNDPESFYMHDYLDYQRSKAAIQEHKKKNQRNGSKGGRASSHKKWHLDRNKPSPQCPLCIEEGLSQA